MKSRERYCKQGPVVLVHGYGDDASLFRRLAGHLAELGRTSHSVTLTPSDGRVPLETLARQLQEYIDGHFTGGQPLDFVGFSMGGILVRYYVQRLGGLARTGRFVSVGTPHHGTWTAFASPRPLARQLRPNSRFLQNLGMDMECLAEIRFMSIWTPLDTMIVPPSSSQMPVGENLRLFILYHQALVTSARGIRTIGEKLTAGP